MASESPLAVLSVRGPALLTCNAPPPTQRGLEHETDKPLPLVFCHRRQTSVATMTGHNASAMAAVLMPSRGQSERVAQPVEHVTFNHGVLGSSPSALTKQLGNKIAAPNPRRLWSVHTIEKAGRLDRRTYPWTTSPSG